MKRENKLPDKVYFRTYFNSKEEPIVTVCTVRGGEKVGRGVAVCSWEDKAEVAKGNTQALRKAVRAMKDRGDERIRDKRAINRLMTTVCPYTFHIEYDPCLSFQEVKALYGKVF